MSILLSNLKSQGHVEWDKWYNQELLSLCEFYVEIKFCKKIKNQIEQFEEFALAVEKVYQHKEQMLDAVIQHSPGLRDYLIIHSVFDADAAQNGDWFIQKMLKILQPTEEDIKRINTKPFVPQELLDKLAIFDPEPIGLIVEPIRIEYGLYKRGGPIIIIDTDWEKLSNTNIPKFLDQFKPIDADTGLDDFESLGIPF